MSNPKPLASLGPSLLARKGGARPAMRPQLGGLISSGDLAPVASADQDDLGWNDLGETAAETVAAPVPEVVRQQRDLASRVTAPRRSALAEGRRAAFTLRLDGERHLKLRLACTVNNRSAQQLLTDALDRLLAESPDIAVLATQVAEQRGG